MSPFRGEEPGADDLLAAGGKDYVLFEQQEQIASLLRSRFEFGSLTPGWIEYDHIARLLGREVFLLPVGLPGEHPPGIERRCH
jgi:hypothetical protein